jgi:hypothetical protein
MRSRRARLLAGAAGVCFLGLVAVGSAVSTEPGGDPEDEAVYEGVALGSDDQDTGRGSETGASGQRDELPFAEDGDEVDELGPLDDDAAAAAETGTGASPTPAAMPDDGMGPGGTPLPVTPSAPESGGFDTEAASDDEVEIDVEVPDIYEEPEGPAPLSTQGAKACAAVERAIEANRVGDTIEADAAVYEAFPSAAGADEPGINAAGASLLDAMTTKQPPLAVALNDVFNACIAAGHGV